MYHKEEIPPPSRQETSVFDSFLCLGYFRQMYEDFLVSTNYTKRYFTNKS